MHARAPGEPELLQNHRRRREALESDRPAPARRARRRRQSTPWLQRNALSVAAIAILVAFLSLGFGLLQMLNRADANSPASLTLAQSELAAHTTDSGTSTVGTTGTTVLSAAAIGPSLQVPASASGAGDPGTRPIQSSATVLQANYTIVAGDTLVKIAQRFNTTVERIQAFNPNLADPRALRIGAQLVVPPPL